MKELNEHQKALKEVERLAFAGEYNQAVLLCMQLPEPVASKAYLLVIELEQINLKVNAAS